MESDPEYICLTEILTSEGEKKISNSKISVQKLRDQVMISEIIFLTQKPHHTSLHI